MHTIHIINNRSFTIWIYRQIERRRQLNSFPIEFV